MRKIGYFQVSSEGQNTARQRKALKDAVNHREKSEAKRLIQR
jgi:DNA invertase Pin-like site-specific DNA recombinase